MEHEQITYENISFSEITNVRFTIIENKGSYTPNHWHSSIELIYVLAGTLYISVGKDKFCIRQGQCILINANVIHDNKSIDYNKYILLQIPIEFMQKYFDANKLIFDLKDGVDIIEKQRKVNLIKKIMLQMNLLQNRKESGYILKFNVLLYKMLWIIYKYFGIEILDSDTNLKSKEQIRLNKIIAYTIQNYKENISLKEIADMVGFQEKYFCRFFKRNMGVSFLEYQNELRLSYIYRDLINSEDKVGKILEKHGFYNYKVFSRMFKEKFGDTPSVIRSKLKNQDRLNAL